MKYLKKFESISDTPNPRVKLVNEEEIKNICEDVFAELFELGFNTNIEKRNTLARPIFEISLNELHIS